MSNFCGRSNHRLLPLLSLRPHEIARLTAARARGGRPLSISLSFCCRNSACWKWEEGPVRTEECLRLSPSLESSNSTGEQKIFHETRAMNSCQIGLFISDSILLCSDKCGGHLFQGSNPRVAVFLKMVGFGREGYQDFCVHSAICMHFPSKRGQPFVRAIHPPSTRHDCPTRRQTRRDESCTDLPQNFTDHRQLWPLNLALDLERTRVKCTVYRWWCPAYPTRRRAQWQ